VSRLRALLSLSCVAAIAVLVAGCGITDPYAETTREERARPPADHEVAKEPAPDPDAGAPPDEVVLATPQGTLRYAASLAGNWEGAGAVRAFSRLAALSTGQARAGFAKIASGASLDVEQTLGYSGSRAAVEAVSVKGEGGFREAIVVTKQRIGSAQLGYLPPEYKVTLATVTRWGKGWAISSWRPQP
jgi:hypothetical protein